MRYAHLTCAAPAKLNLFLLVTGRRADGYHTLQTLFRFIDFGDTLTFAAARRRRDSAQSAELAGVPEEHDLTVRAARLLQQETACTLGRGDRDHQAPADGRRAWAGAARMRRRRCSRSIACGGLSLPRAQLQELGCRLGADVPVFVFGRNALAEGIGERLQAVDLPPAWYVVLVPPVAVSTAAVFADRELTRYPVSGHNTRLFREMRLAAFKAARPQRSGGGGVPALSGGRAASELAAAFRPGSDDGFRRLCFLPVRVRGHRAGRCCRQVPASMQGFVAAGLAQHPLCDWAE